MECNASNPETEPHCGRCWKLQSGWLGRQGRQRHRVSKRSSKAVSSRSNGYASSDLDSDNEERMPWVPVEKALQRLRSSEQVTDSDSNHTAYEACHGVESPLTKQSVLPQKSVQNECSQTNSTQDELPSCSYRLHEKTMSESGINTNSTRHSIQKCASLPNTVRMPSFTDTPSPICNTGNHSTRKMISLGQRSSTPVSTYSSSTDTTMNGLPTTDSLSNKESTVKQNSLSHISNMNSSVKSTCDDSSLNVVDSGISSMESYLSESLLSSQLSCHRGRSVPTSQSRCHSAPTTPVKISTADGKNCLLSPTKRLDMLEKYKGRLSLLETRRTLSHYQVTSPSTSSRSLLKHCSSAPSFSNSLDSLRMNSSSSIEMDVAKVESNSLLTSTHNSSEVFSLAHNTRNTETEPEQKRETEPVPAISNSQMHRANLQTDGQNELKDSSNSTINQPNVGTDHKDMCVICLTKPKEASIIHGRTGHQVCCYSCAKRLRRRGKPCPVCRRPINRVIKNYVM